MEDESCENVRGPALPFSRRWGDSWARARRNRGRFQCRACPCSAQRSITPSNAPRRKSGRILVENFAPDVRPELFQSVGQPIIDNQNAKVVAFRDAVRSEGT